MIVSILCSYAISQWACAYGSKDSKYLCEIDRFCKRGVKYSCTAKFTPITDLIQERDLELSKKVTTDNKLPCPVLYMIPEFCFAI